MNDDNKKTSSDEPAFQGMGLGPEQAEPAAIPDELPVLAAHDTVLYPHIVLPLVVSGERDVKLLNDVLLGNRIMAVVAAKNPEADPPKPDDLHSLGCAVAVLRMMRFPDDTTRILVQGIARINLREYVRTDPYLVARVQRLDSRSEESVEFDALVKTAVDFFQKLVDLSPHLPDELKVAVMNIDDKSRLADVIAATLNIPFQERQRILETLDVAQRFRIINIHLSRALNTAELSSKIQSQVRSEMDKDQREFMLRRQLKAIQEELGEEDPQTAELKELQERIDKLKLPVEARKEATRELERLKHMPPQAAEYHVARTYLEWIIALPWNKSTRDKLDIAAAEKILDADHYDLEKVKQRIIEYLAVRKLKKDTRGPILCFAGPPGTGKTSLGRSIARALGRKFVRISLGGVRDEAEIRGHRRTYVGALPGRIIQGLRKAESNNPVFMLDEIDKLGADFRGDPSAALLEVLDPEQNFSFSDHYLDVPFDLSRVMFITTANVLHTIPSALLDRMEILELPGYTLEEKTGIARQYLIPRQLHDHGLKNGDLDFPDDVLREIITRYTREAGLRNLERRIGALCRKRATQIARAKTAKRKKYTLRSRDLTEMLGPPQFTDERAERTSEPGVATGLAWTSAGGQILFIESTRYPGNGKLLLTGKLGDVMKESAQAALSYIRAHSDQLGISRRVFANADLHIHVPAGAIPKDGPSAGITIAASLISLFTGRPVRSDLAMTGEITLRGHVLPVGGIKEKVLAAHHAGIKTIILPKRNKKDLADVPDTARKGLRIAFAETVADLLPLAFDSLPARKKPPQKNAAKPKPRKKTRRKTS